ncbi:MAG: nitrate ABC transporter, permease protein, partial [Thiobacillus sp.]|nr:nitrate ABC transporter, permease protein [Thiobacillus sp.]
MSAINATPENLSEILSGEDVVLASQEAPAAVSRVRRTPYFETESGQRFIEGTVNLFKAAVPPLLGILLFAALWALVANTNKSIPGPVETWDAAVVLFSDPFYDNGPNDKGIGWNILNSLYRVGLGFGAAAIIGIPLGFLIGRFQFLSQMLSPIISILRPVSPLAWLPIGLLVLQKAEPASIWVIFISSIWPMVLNTAAGVQRIPQDY